MPRTSPTGAGIERNAWPVVGSIKATFDKGVLEITVPKPEQAKPHKVQITAGGGESQAIDGGESTESAADEQVAA